MANGINQDIAVVGSPSTNTELTIDLLQEATEERLVGALTAFTAIQNGSPITAVGQVVGIELKNRWHEDSVFRNLVKRTGEIPPITNRQDTRVASLVVGATFKRADKGYEPDVLGMVPSTGTRIARVDQALLDQLLSVYQKEIFYLGRAYANDVLYPMWFKHFGSGPGGAGEAYHLAIFGKTGSGKSVLAKNILLAYAQHKPPKQMGLLVIDPQGEFARDFGSGLGTGSYKLDYKSICIKIDREVVVRKVPDIRLDRWNLFADLISRTQLFPRLTIRTSDWIRNAADVLSERLKEEKVKLTALHKKESYETALQLLKEDRSLKQIYSGKEGRDRLKDMLDDVKVTAPLFEEAWFPVTKLFRETDDSGQRRPITEEVIDLVLRKDDRCLVIMDLSGAGLSALDKQTFWSEEVQALLLSRITEALIRKAEDLYGKESLNALVILDEAHRLAGTEYFDDDSDRAGLRKQLIDGVRTTRKYGLGWMFISQSLASSINPLLISAASCLLVLGSLLEMNLDGSKNLREGTSDPWSSIGHSVIQRASQEKSFVSSLSWLSVQFLLWHSAGVLSFLALSQNRANS